MAIPPKAAPTPDAFDLVSSNKSREAGQAQRAAAQAAEEFLTVPQAEQITPVVESVEPQKNSFKNLKDWQDANPHMAEKPESPLCDGKVLHVFDDGHWLQHIGRNQFTVRPPEAIELIVGQMVNFKKGKAFIVQAQKKGWGQ